MKINVDGAVITHGAAITTTQDHPQQPENRRFATTGFAITLKP